MSYDKLDVAWMKDRDDRWTQAWHNALGQLIGTQDAAARVTWLEWCKCGDLKSILDPAGQKTLWRHDISGRITRKEFADGTAENFVYDLAGRLSTRTDALGQTTTSTYFADNAVKGITYAGGPTATANVTFSFDVHYRRLVSMSDGTGSSAFTYYPVGQLGAGQPASIDGPLSGTTDRISFTYDALGRRATRNVGTSGSENLVSWSRDTRGRISSIATPLGLFENAFVGTSNRLSSTQYPNGQRALIGYFGVTADSRLESILNLADSTDPLSTLSRFDYGYSPGGTIHSQARQLGTTPATRYDFDYDAVDQLTSAILSDPASPTQVISQQAFAYDVAGNRVNTQRDNQVLTATFNRVNELTNTTGGGKILVSGSTDEPAKVRVNGKPALTDADSRWQCWVDVFPGSNTITVEARDYAPQVNATTRSWTVNVTGAAARTFTYDSTGNTLHDGTRAYQWDAANRLVKITQGTDNYEFTYDGFSRRVAEKVNGAITRRWIWDGSEIIEQRAADGTTVQRRYYPHGEQRVGGADAGSYFYTRDHLGSIRELTDATASVRARYDYDPWGNRTKLDGDLDCDLGFTGHHTHSLTDLVLTHYRAYDPETGRWLSRDPIGEAGGINLYGYVSNNPVDLWDPLGLFESHPWLRATVPGQVSWDNALTSFENGNVGTGVGFLGAMLAEQGLAVATFGQGSALMQGSRTTTYCTVTRWQNPASEALQTGNWVIKGEKNLWNWAMSGKMNPLRPQRHVPFNQGRMFQVPESTLRNPTGLEGLKAVPPWNQRRFYP